LTDPLSGVHASTVAVKAGFASSSNREVSFGAKAFLFLYPIHSIFLSNQPRIVDEQPGIRFAPANIAVGRVVLRA
jgi:hypothetical protein